MNNESTIFRRGVPALLFGALFCWLFAEAIFFSNILNYRDTSHFFSRLFQLVQDEWSQGRVPLWTPYTNCGVPLVANATSSVFYPGKLIFFLPIPFVWAYNWYVMGHVLLAGALSYGLARSWGTSRFAATICALSYVFCGNVFYQYANVIFLVGAAWLPAAMWATDRMLRERSVVAAVWLGVILALMVLGGDPHMAYHVGLLAALYAFFLWRKKEAASDSEFEQKRPLLRERSIVLLAIAATSGLVLSAIQVLPTLEWSRECVRSRHVLPRNLYEVPAYFSQDVRFDQHAEVNWYDNLLGKSVDPPPTEALYDYSVAPWRVTEFVWPRISGCSLSQYRRWIHGLAGEPDWTPTMYMGILPLLLAMIAWKFHGGDVRTNWISAVLVLSLIAAFGKFGLGWLLQICFGSASAEGGSAQLLGDPFGGLYWLMTTVLPGYAQFRWPAKLLTVTAMCASLLAAQGWDTSINGAAARLKQSLLVVAVLSVLGLAMALISGPWWRAWLSGMRTSSVLGPFDVIGAHRDVTLSFLSTAIICAVLVALLRFIDLQKSWKWQGAVVTLVAVELGMANGWMVAVTPASEFQRESELAQLIQRAQSRHASGPDDARPPFRVYLGSFQPKHWKNGSSPDRFRELNQWAHDAIYPMHHFASRVELVNVESDTFHNYDHGLLLLPSPWFSASNQVSSLQPRRALDAMNVKYFIVPKSGTALDRGVEGLRNSWIGDSSRPPRMAPTGESLESVTDENASGRDLGEFELLYNRDCLPRAWVVHNVIDLAPIERRSFTRLSELSTSISFPSQQELSLRKTAIIESAGFQDLPARPAPVNQPETCRITHYDPQRVEIAVCLKQPGLVVLGDLYEKNWVAEDIVDVKSTPLQIHRTNRVMRGVRLEAGEHRIVFRYVPTRFYFGAVISALGWLALLAIAIVKRLRSSV